MRKIGFVLAGLTPLTTPLLAQASVQDKADFTLQKQLAVRVPNENLAKRSGARRLATWT